MTLMRVERRKLMSVIIYTGSDQTTFERLNRVMQIVFPGNSVDTCTTLEGLVKKLCRPGFKSDVTIAVLVAADRSEVDAFIDRADVFEDVRIILVLPDGEQETISKGHLLRPRFLTYVDADFTDLAAVLAKMLAAERDCPKGEHTGVVWKSGQDGEKHFNA
jgi:hypothetical protein